MRSCRQVFFTTEFDLDMFWIYFGISALIGAVIGASKGHAGWGLVFALFYGPIGWIVAGFKKPDSSFGSWLFMFILTGGLIIGVGWGFMHYASRQDAARAEERAVETAAKEEAAAVESADTAAMEQYRRDLHEYNYGPKFDRYGKPINRVAPVLPGATNAPVAQAATPLPVSAPPQTPADVQAEILRKYGSGAR